MSWKRELLSKAVKFQFVGQSHGTTNYVILSKRSASKNLRTYGLSARRSVRRSFDSLRSLRMTMGGFVQDFSECEILGTACVPFLFPFSCRDTPPGVSAQILRSTDTRGRVSLRNKKGANLGPLLAFMRFWDQLELATVTLPAFLSRVSQMPSMYMMPRARSYRP